ncbi:MAG: hypothetical protein P4L36_03045 [Holophaga sp.]|nr:hypothetical protein [Holophaga sp.]
MRSKPAGRFLLPFLALALAPMAWAEVTLRADRSNLVLQSGETCTLTATDSEAGDQVWTWSATPHLASVPAAAREFHFHAPFCSTAQTFVVKAEARSGGSAILEIQVVPSTVADRDAGAASGVEAREESKAPVEASGPAMPAPGLHKVHDDFYVAHCKGSFFAAERLRSEADFATWRRFAEAQDLIRQSMRATYPSSLPGAGVEEIAEYLEEIQLKIADPGRVSKVRPVQSATPSELIDLRDRIQAMYLEELAQWKSTSEGKNMKYFEVIRGADDPLAKMQFNLSMIKDAEIWMVYATDKMPETRLKFDFPEKISPKAPHYQTELDRAIAELKHVTMSVVVTTRPGEKVQTHLGIVRGMAHFQQHVFHGGELKNGIATLLHGFAASVLLAVEPSRRLIVCSPLKQMHVILTKSLPKDSFRIGSNSEDSLIRWGSTPKGGSYIQVQDWDGGTVLECRDGVEEPRLNRWFALTTPCGRGTRFPYFVINQPMLAAQFSTLMDESAPSL